MIASATASKHATTKAEPPTKAGSNPPLTTNHTTTMKFTFALLILFAILAVACLTRSESPAGLFRSKAQSHQAVLEDAMALSYR
jgi:hypothetical protein